MAHSSSASNTLAVPTPLWAKINDADPLFGGSARRAGREFYTSGTLEENKADDDRVAEDLGLVSKGENGYGARWERIGRKRP